MIPPGFAPLRAVSYEAVLGRVLGPQFEQKCLTCHGIPRDEGAESGIRCESCHGPVNKMPLMWQHGTLLMEWCLECHRAPEKNLRPKEAVFDMDWTAARIGASQEELGPNLALEYHVGKLIHCSTCHR